MDRHVIARVYIEQGTNVPEWWKKEWAYLEICEGDEKEKERGEELIVIVCTEVSATPVDGWGATHERTKLPGTHWTYIMDLRQRRLLGEHIHAAKAS